MFAPCHPFVRFQLVFNVFSPALLLEKLIKARAMSKTTSKMPPYICLFDWAGRFLPRLLNHWNCKESQKLFKSFSQPFCQTNLSSFIFSFFRIPVYIHCNFLCCFFEDFFMSPFCLVCPDQDPHAPSHAALVAGSVLRRCALGHCLFEVFKIDGRDFALFPSKNGFIHLSK